MENKQGILIFLYRLAGRIRWKILVLLSVQMMIGLCGVFYALAFRYIIDAAVDGSRQGLVSGVTGFAALACFQLFLRAVGRWMAESARSGMENRLKEYLYGRLMERDYAAVTAVHSGEWMNRLTNDTAVVANAVTELIPGAGGMAVRLAGALVMISILEPYFLCLILPAGAALLLFSSAFRKVMKQLHRQVQESDGALRIFLQETLESLLVIRSYSVGKTMELDAGKKMEDHRESRMKRNRFSVLCNLGFGFLMNLAYVSGALVCGIGILRGTMSYGTFTAVIQLIGQVQAPFANLSGLMPGYYSMLASAERLLEAEQLPDKRGENVLSAEQIRDLYENRLEAVGITGGRFTYCPPAGNGETEGAKETRPVVLSGLELEIRKGDYTAFVGASGCGKSTVLKLLMCLFRLDEGECYVQLEGSRVPLTAEWQRLFAYVPQGNCLMSGTVREIVSLADRADRNNEDRIQRALEIACADEFVDELENGKDTLLGEKGKGLSEGQMQRLAIARAVFSDCPVLLLDECTSALDPATEKQLLANLKRMTDKTVILVTHRSEALKICDQIVTFSENGVVSKKTNPEGFHIRVADHVIEIVPGYPDIRKLCQEYICAEGKPEYQIRVTRQEIERERNGENFSEGYLETLAVYRKLAAWMLDRNILLFHSSAVAVQGRAYLFTAPSGTGKSTHTGLWREVFGEEAVMINDDKPLIRIEKDQVTVFGTPWNGKHRLGNNISAPLQGICVLAQGRENVIRKIKKTEAFPLLFNQIYRPDEEKDKTIKLLSMLDRLLQIPVWRMECTISREAAVLAYETMKGEKYEIEKRTDTASCDGGVYVDPYRESERRVQGDTAKQ